MITALQCLPAQPKPSLAHVSGLLAGHKNIADMVRGYLEPGSQDNAGSDKTARSMA
jgi:hypothetical protein